MCTTDLCNANDFNIHTERIQQLIDLFTRPQTSTSKVTVVTPASVESTNEVLERRDYSVKVKDGDQERTENIWSEKNIELFVDESKDEVTARSPRQTQGNIVISSKILIFEKTKVFNFVVVKLYFVHKK